MTVIRFGLTRKMISLWNEIMENDAMEEREPPGKQERRFKRFRLSGKLLTEMLMLPKGSKIVRISQYDTSFGKCDADIIVHHPNFNSLPSGSLIPECRPTYQKEICGDRERLHFVSWGIEIDESDKTQECNPQDLTANDER